MFEINYKSINKGNKITYLFLVVGVIITLIFLFLFIHGILKKNSLDREVKADYIEENAHYDDEGSLMYSPVYHYTVNGKEYTCGGSFSSSKRPSSKGVVYYKKGDPSNCMTDYSSRTNWFMLIGVALGAVCAAVGFSMKQKVSKEVKKAKYLSQNGKLIKGIPYRMEDTGTVVNGRTIQRIVIDYILPTGSTITLRGNPRYDKFTNQNGLADLLIDPNDNDNYYIDFDIKYSGNVQVENYKYQNQVNINQNQNVDPMLRETVNNIENAAQAVQNVSNGINTAKQILDGTITIGDNDKENY